MVELGIPPTPTNYTVWYHYFGETYPDLKHSLDALLAAGETVTARQCADIFERYFTFDQEGATLHGASSRIEQAMSRAVGYLSDAGAGAAEFGEVLAGATGELSGQTGTSNVKEIVDGVLTATREMEERTRDLERKLEASVAEVSELRQEVEMTRREATTDALTGIANRKLFDSTLRQAAGAAAENGESLCLLMLDIDHFKQFNDSHGHQTGDQVLKLLAHTLTEGIKGQDTAARYGGEEFGVILPQTELEHAAGLADDIRRRLASKNIVNRRTGEQLGTITLSIGVAILVPGESMTNLIARADTAMYAAKDKGRNCVVTEKELVD